MTPRRLSLGAAAESSFPLVSRICTKLVSCIFSSGYLGLVARFGFLGFTDAYHFSLVS